MFLIRVDEPPSSLEDAIRIIIGSQFVRTTPGLVPTTEVESIHESRVAIRKLRATLSVYKSFLVPKPTRMVMSNVRKIDGLLLPIRDLDVVRSLVSKVFCSENATSLVRLQSFLAEQRGELASRLFPALTTERARHAQTLIVTFGKCPPLRKSTLRSDNDYQRILKQLLEKEVSSLVNQTESCLAKTSSLSLHRLRLAAKSVRYQCDTLSPLGIFNPVHAHWYAKTLHSELGRLQDFRTLTMWLNDHQHFDSHFKPLARAMRAHTISQKNLTMQILQSTHQEFLSRR